MPAIGELAKTGHFVAISRLTDATGVTKGDVCSFQATGLVQKNPTALADGPFGVAKDTKGASVVVTVFVEGYVYVTADGTINPNKYVIGSGTTAGQVVVATKQAISATYVQAEIQAVQNELWRRVGIYIGHVAEEEDPTNAADGDVIVIKLGVSF